MKFIRPVDYNHKVMHHFCEWGTRWEWVVDKDTTLWIPRGSAASEGQHRGVDFDCPEGTLVTAMTDGMVVQARYENPLDYKDGDGLHIIHLVMMAGFDAWWVKYSHLKDSLVHIGEKIQRGQPIGYSGKSGNPGIAMLHVDLRDTRKQYHQIPWQ